MSNGRWPANIVFTHGDGCAPGNCARGCPVAELDAQSGISKGVYSAPKARQRNNGIGLGTNDIRYGISNAPDNYGDQGGASRYFQQFYNTPEASASNQLLDYLEQLITPPGGQCIMLRLGANGEKE